MKHKKESKLGVCVAVRNEKVSFRMWSFLRNIQVGGPSMKQIWSLGERADFGSH